MDYQEWIPLLGLAADDERIITRLAAYGWNAPIAFGPEDFYACVDFKNNGMSIRFESEFTLRNKGVLDLPILASVSMFPVLRKIQKKWTAYSDPLPFNLKLTFSKSDVIVLFGEPENSSNSYSARWLLDSGQRYLSVQFGENWESIKQLGVGIPSRPM